MPINQDKTSEYEEIPLLTYFHLAMNVKDLMSTRSFSANFLVQLRGAAHLLGLILICLAINFRFILVP